MAEENLVALGELATTLRVSRSVLHRLVRAGALKPRGVDGSRRKLFRPSDYLRVRMLLDLLEAGVAPRELRAMEQAAHLAPTAAGAAAVLAARLDDIIPRLTARLQRLQRLREDAIRTRESLYRCRACYKPFSELACRSCAALAPAQPQLLDAFFFGDLGDASED